MTSRVSSSPGKPQSAPAGETTPAELGKLVSNAETANVVLETTRGALNMAKETLKNAPPAKKAAAQKDVERLQKTYDQAFDRWSAADGAVNAAVAKLAGPKLAQKTERLYQAYEKTIAARDAQKPGSPAWKQLDAAATRLQKPLEARQEVALEKSRAKSETQADADLDGLTDVASRSREEQIRLTGAPIVNVNKDQAAAFDRAKVSRAMKGAFTEYGIQMLAEQFTAVDEAGQLKLLQLLSDPKRDHLSKIIENAGKPGAAQFMVDALANAKGAARTQLLERLTAKIDGPNHPFLQRLGSSPTFQKNAEITGAVMQSLKKAGKTEAANALAEATTGSLRTLRKEFEAKKKLVDAHNAEFSRTVAGYAGAVDPKKLEAYRDKFVAAHKADFDSYNEVAGRYMEVFKSASSGTFGPLEQFNPMSAEGKLRGELSLAVSEHGEAILNTEPGKKELDAAMKLQMLKQPSWLDQLSAGAGKVKDKIELPGKVADLAAKAMVRVAMAGGAGPGALTALVQKNAKLLGISGEQAESFAKLMGQVNAPHLTDAQRAAAYKNAAGELSGGEYANAKSMKALGLLLAGPGLVGGWIDFKNKPLMDQVSHSLDTLGFANDLLSLVSDAKVIGTAGKILGGAGAAIGLVKGVAALSEGKLLEGGTSLASAAGGALLMVPGGQLFGAALIIGSTIASAIWGEDPAADAEAKQEKNVKEFLVDAGVKPEIASVLSDVLQTNHRSTGPFIEQMAEYLGVQPSDFLQFLNGKKPEEVRALVNMVKNMPTDKEWNFTKAKDKGIGTDDTPYVQSAGRRNDYVAQGPRSLETAKQWMKDHDLLPPGAR